MRTEIRIAGTGGQGQVLAAQVLAEAAGVYGGMHAVQTQFYEPSIRGGSACGDVVISDEPISFPWVLAPDVLVAQHQVALDYQPGRVREGMTNLDDLKPTSIVLADTVYVTRIPTMRARTYKVPLTLAADQVGMRRAANMVTLGALARITGLVGLEALEKAVLNRAPRGKEEINLKALRAGYALDPAALEEVPAAPL